MCLHHQDCRPLPPSQDPWYTAPIDYKLASPGAILRIRTDPSNITAVVSAAAAYNILYVTTDTNYQPSWAVTTFLGPQASFALGPHEGHAVLDSIRAVLSSQHFHATPETSHIAMWGYSGGSIASTFAAELHASYAPELEIAGMAIGGLVPNATEVYSAAREFLLSQLKTSGTYNATGLLEAFHLTFAESNAYYSTKNISEYFTHGLKAFLDAPEMTRVLGNNGFQGYHGIPQMPVFAYKAVNDEQHELLSNVLSGVQPQNLTSTGCTWIDVSVNVTAVRMI
ncbi:LIP-domain-containing protein [Xylariaceae sp. FL1272]|nr:LIP-domain-containing protein [Xylariaceae sp. FL1272]